MLFNELPKDCSPPDDINIVSTLLYYSEEQMREFKTLCKKGMIKDMPGYQEGNVSDFLLLLLRKNYDT